MPTDPADSRDRLARIERMIEEFRSVKRRQALRRAMRLWRRAEARQQLLVLDAPPDRVH